MTTQPTLFALAALVVTTGVTVVGGTYSPAQADPMPVVDDGAGYFAARIDAAFNVVAEMPPMDPVAMPMADKGDLLPITAGAITSDPVQTSTRHF